MRTDGPPTYLGIPLQMREMHPALAMVIENDGGKVLVLKTALEPKRYAPKTDELDALRYAFIGIDHAAGEDWSSFNLFRSKPPPDRD